ncbi:MAG: GerMN domain-containing protein [Thermodesulfovibrio sp.]|nr:GerMN domain-containing protein [Thermodesulfovibrio sp.]MCX7724684.1 GerMN domain-containing protein [Thermodesulfovibrio sp.]MDW7971875.1 GerMN domain-containing protein [Thermodesulfovibrio sp.]
MNKKVIIVFSILIVVIAGFIIYFHFLKSNKLTYYEKPKHDKVLENFKIYIPSSNALMTKEVYLKRDESETKNIEKILENFIAELSSPFKDTKILGVYRDKENIVYIDLSKSFTSPQSMREEYLLIKALYKTLKENFTWIKDVKILIESKEVDTISGHISNESYLKEILEEG